jgi:hypothetical protein
MERVYARPAAKGFTLGAALLTSTAFAGVTAAVFAFAAGLALQGVDRKTTVNVGFESVTWWTKSQFAVEKSVEPLEEVREARTPPTQTPQKAPLQIARKRTSVTPPKRVARKVVAPIVVPALETDELLSFRQIHQGLRTRFLAVAHDQLKPSTPLVEVVVAQVQAAPLRVKKSFKQPKRLTTQVRESIPAPVEKVDLRPLQEKLVQLTTQLNQLSPLTPPTEPLIQPIATEEVKEPAPVVAAAPSIVTPPAPQTTAIESSPIAREDHRFYPELPIVTTQTAPIVVEAPIPAVTTQSQTVVSESEVTTQDVSSQPVLVTMGPSESFGPPAPVIVTRVDEPKASPPPTTSDLLAVADPSRASAKTKEVEDRTLRGVEAFHWEAELPAVSFSTLSHQGTVRDASDSWVIGELRGYWPTLALRHTDRLGSRIPLISPNSIKSIEWIGKTEVQKDRALIFGTLPDGFKVALLKGATGTPSWDNAWVSSGDFVIPNVTPGAHRLHLASADGRANAILVVPAVQGVATFLDLTAIEVRTLKGAIWDAGYGHAVPVSGASVTVAGVESTRVVSDASGRFKIEDQLVVRGHPLFLDTDVAGEFTHRYSVDPAAQGPLSLFRFSDKQLMGWIGQLNGGVHVESGVLVAALPNVPGALPRDRLVPFVQSLNDKLPFTPEVYTIAQDHTGADRLEVKRPLTAGASRVFAAELAGGAHILGLEDERGQAKWSRWFVADPGVVNVITSQ